MLQPNVVKAREVCTGGMVGRGQPKVGQGLPAGEEMREEAECGTSYSYRTRQGTRPASHGTATTTQSPTAVMEAAFH